MRKPSPIRVWNWLAAAGLLLCLASFGAAQKKDPPTGGASVPAEAAGKALASVGEEESHLQKRSEWFYRQRAYPLGFIPPNARLNALKEMDAMIEEEIKSGLRPPKGAVAPQQQGSVEPRIGFPFSTTGASIGPTPENNTFGNPFFGTPTDSGRVSAIAVDPSDVTGKTVYIGGANGGIWKSTDSGAHWTPLTDTQNSLAIGSIAIAPSSPSTIYVGTGEQDFVSINPTTGGENYYGAGVLKSIDAGATWTQLAGPFTGPLSNLVGGARIPAIAVHPTNPSIVVAGVVFTSSAGVDAGIYRTADGGTTWTQILTASGAIGTGVVFDPSNGNNVFVALGRGGGNSNNGVYKSTDAGLTFTKLAGGLPTVNVGRIELAIAASSPTTVYASIADSSTGSGNLLGLFKTTNGGTTWTQLQSGSGPGAFDYCGGQCFYSHAIAVSPVNPNFVIAGGTAGFGAGIPASGQTVFRSTDGGMTFTDIHIGSSGVRVHSDQHAFKFSGDGSVLYDGNDGGVWRTDNPTALPGTLDWVNLNGTATLAEFYPGFAVDENNANRAVGGTQDNGTIAFSGNVLWDQIACGDGAGNLIDRKVPSTVYIMCTSGNSPYIQRSLTGGGTGTFVPIQSGIPAGDLNRTEFIPFITMDHSSTNILYTPTFKVYRSMDWGTNWTAISPDLTANGVSSIAVVAVADSNSNVVYAATDDARVWRTTNALSASPTWTNLNTTDLPNRFFTSIATDGSDPTGNTAFLGASGFKFGGDTKGHVFQTINGGVSWTDISGNLPNIPVNAIVTGNTAGTLFVGTDIGVFTTSNGGTTWTTFATALPRVAVLSLAGTGAVGFAATHGRGVFAVDIFGSIPAGPALASISPSFKAAGSATFTLTADGANFTMASKVEWDHSQTGVATTFVSANQLTAMIDSSLLTPGVHDVTVLDGTESNRLRFAVTGSAPTLTSINPTITNPGGPAFPLTATGTGFICGGSIPTLVDFGGDLLTPTTCSSTSMTVTVPAADIATTRSVPVVAFTTPPGGGASNALSFTVGTPPANDNFANAITASPTPFTDTKDTTLATTEVGEPFPNPATCTSGEDTANSHSIWYYFIAPSNGTINADTHGSNYDTILQAVTGSALGAFTPVACNDDTNFPTDLTSQVSFAATSGVRYSFMVSGFGDGSTSFGAAVFHLTFTSSGGNPVPTLTSISPNVGNVGQTISMTLTGTGFNSQSVVKFGATSNTGGTVSNNGTTLTISIPGTELTAPAMVAVTVFNPTPGGGTSAGLNFTISDFTVSSPTGEQTVAAGGSATFTITLATQGGPLANDVTFSVTGLPPASTGTFNPTSFAKGTNGGMSTLTIATTKRGAVPPLKTPRPPRPNPLLWLLAAALAMVSYSLLRRGWRTRRLALYLPLALLVLAAAFIAGCGGGGGGGGGGGQTGTPAGTYNVTVTATSGGVAHSTQVMIMVQ